MLLAADGTSSAEVSRRVGVSLPTVRSWRDRYASGGLTALDDRPRSGRLAVHDEQAIIAATLDKPPAVLGLKPGKTETFKFSTDPELETALGGRCESAALAGSPSQGS